MTLPDTMRAMVTMGHGDLDRIVPHSDRAALGPIAAIHEAAT